MLTCRAVRELLTADGAAAACQICRVTQVVTATASTIQSASTASPPPKKAKVMGPALPPAPIGHVFPCSSGTCNPKVLVELYMDLACPFAGRMFATLRQFMQEYCGSDKGVVWKMYQVVQPWHPQSTYMHEAALAVKAVKPDAFFPFCAAVWEARESKFIDDVTIDKTRNQIYDDLADIAAVVGVDRAAVRDKLKLKAAGNMGTFMTQEIKWACQYHRRRGVHVTPTAFVNGIEVGTISSASTVEEWKALLDSTLAL